MEARWLLTFQRHSTIPSSKVQLMEYKIFFCFVKGIHEFKLHWILELRKIMMIGQSLQLLTFIRMMYMIHPFMMIADERLHCDINERSMCDVIVKGTFDEFADCLIYDEYQDEDDDTLTFDVYKDDDIGNLTFIVYQSKDGN